MLRNRRLIFENVKLTEISPPVADALDSICMRIGQLDSRGLLAFIDFVKICH